MAQRVQGQGLAAAGRAVQVPGGQVVGRPQQVLLAELGEAARERQGRGGQPKAAAHLSAMAEALTGRCGADATEWLTSSYSGRYGLEDAFALEARRRNW